MSQMNRSVFSPLMTVGLKKNFGISRDIYPVQYKRYMDLEKSTKAREQYQEEADFGLFSTKPEGQNIQLDTAASGPQTTLVNVTYGLGFQVTQELVEDDQYGIINKLPKSLAKSAMQTKEIKAQNVLNNGYSSSFPGGNGQPLFSLVQPTVLGGGTYQNRSTVASSLSETSLTADLVEISNMLDGRGKKMMVLAQMLIVPPALDTQAAKLLNSTLEAATNNNAINPFARGQGRLPKGYMVANFLTNPAAYFIRTDKDGLIYQERRALNFFEDVGVSAQIKKYYATYREAYGWYDPRSIYGNPGQ